MQKDLKIKTICMLRPRGAGFNYSQEEIETILEDASLFLENGVDGLAFGFLNKNKAIDVEKTRLMTDLIHNYKKEAVFHRAFDLCDDLNKAIEVLIELGIDRVLTSGGAVNAIEGIENLNRLNKKYGSKIEILAGCGINENNVKELIDKTGVTQIHTSAKKWIEDETTFSAEVDYSYLEKGKYECASKNKIRKILYAMGRKNN